MVAPDIPGTPLIGIVGARGGIGTSTLAAALALVAAERYERVALIDGSPRNGLEVLLGIDEHQGPTWQELARSHGASRRRQSHGDEGVTVLAWQAMDQVPDSLARSAVESLRDSQELLIADVGTVSTPLERALLDGAGAIVFLVPGEVRALTYAAHLTPVLQDIAPVHLVVCQPSPTSIADDEIADLLNLPLAGVLQRESRLPVRGEHGQLPTRRLLATVRAVSSAVGI